VHTTELLDASRYLQGGELILTTGVWRTRRGAEDDFVAALVRARVCGLVYGLPKPHARMPRALIDACESHGLPLLEASFDLPFIAISRAVIDNFADEHRVALASALHRSDQLVSAVLNGNVTEGVLSVLARKDGLHPWLLEPDGSVVGSSQSSLEADLIGLVIRATREGETFPVEVKSLTGRRGTAFAVVDGRPDDRFLIVEKGQTELVGEEIRAIEQALAFLRIESARVDAVRAVEARFSRELIDLIEAGDRVSEVSARLRSFDLDPDRRLAALVVSGVEEGERVRVVDLLETFFSLRDSPTVVALRSADVVAIFGPPEAERPLTDVGHELAAALTSSGTNLVAIGTGAAVPNANGLRRSLIEAQHAANVLPAASEGEIEVRTHAELASHRLLLALQDADLRRTFADALLGAVGEYDAHKKTNLLQTLNLFLANGGHWQRTAHSLNIHVNTLRYRLACIERLTGRDLNSMETRVDFFLALCADDIDSELRHGGDRLPQ